ncbi:MAG: ABC transporter ATP-binding protein [Chthoniobacterales bacterium]|nr:ABC transporter ATP-binding protein [Chthoniobacterales bacterium]
MTKQRKSWIQRLREHWKPYAELLAYLVPYKRRFFFGVGMGVLYALLNGAIPLLVKYVGDRIFPGGADQETIRVAAAAGTGERIDSVLLVCLLVPVVMMLRGFFSYLNAYEMTWVSLRVLNDIRTNLFASIAAQSMEFFDKARAGKLMSKVMNDTKVAQSSLSQLSVNIFKQPIALVTGVAVLMAIDWKFSLTTLVLFPICIIPVAVHGRKVRKAGKAEEQLAGEMNVILQETFSGIRVIKSFAREKFMLKSFEEATVRQFKNSLRVKKSTELTTPLVEVVAAVGVGLALFYVYAAELSAAKFLALMAGIFLLYEPVKALSRIHLQLQKCLAATISIFELMRRPPAIVDTPGAVKLDFCRGEIVFDSVSFAYGPQVQALRDASLHIAPGQRVALVGPSGSGKTTMLSLILRFYDPQGGAVRLDGHDLRSLQMDSLREHVGIVTQDTFLFHDTILNNIRFGCPDATPEQVEEAAKRAYAHEFILAQPQGYDSIVGDKGCMLSGGQQQRLAIARALLKNAPVLLLDEATSALDSESERMIQSALEKLSAGKTVVAIAHRLSTVLTADMIAVMNHGRVLATGSHAELLDKSPEYRTLYEIQFHHAPATKEAVPA